MGQVFLCGNGCLSTGGGTLYGPLTIKQKTNPYIHLTISQRKNGNTKIYGQTEIYKVGNFDEQGIYTDYGTYIRDLSEPSTWKNNVVTDAEYLEIQLNNSLTQQKDASSGTRLPNSVFDNCLRLVKYRKTGGQVKEHKGFNILHEGNYNNYKSKAIYSDNLLKQYDVPTFVYWDINTKNTPYTDGMTKSTCGSAIVHGNPSTDRTKGWYTCIAFPLSEGFEGCYSRRVSGGTIGGWLKNFSSQGGTITGVLRVAGGSGHIEADANHINITAYSERNNTTNRNSLLVLNDTYLNTIKTDYKDAVKFRHVVGDQTSDYTIWGNHNKPTGTYQGQKWADYNYSQSNPRKIHVGGIGKVVMVSNEDYTIFIHSNGAFYFGYSTYGYIYPSNMQFVNGEILMYNTNSVYNKVGSIYTYQLL